MKGRVSDVNDDEADVFGYSHTRAGQADKEESRCTSESGRLLNRYMPSEGHGE